MKKRIKSPKSKTDKYLSVIGTSFANSFINKKIRFNSNPSKNSKNSEDKQISINNDVNSSYSEIGKKIDNLIKECEGENITWIHQENGMDAPSHDTPEVNLKESIKNKKPLEKKLKHTTVKKENQSKPVVNKNNVSNKLCGKNFPKAEPTNVNLVKSPEPKITSDKHTIDNKYILNEGANTLLFDNLDQNCSHQIMNPEIIQIESETDRTNQRVLETNNGLRKEDELYSVSTKMETVNEPDNNKKLVDEKTGFGWKGLGSRRIVFDNRKKEYRYEVIEPQLEEREEDIKDKIIYFFRTGADLDVFNMQEKEKMQYLEEALQKIIDENHFKLEDESKDKIFYHIFRNFVGYDKIDILMHDEGIEDISCDGHGIPIFIFHKKHESISSNIIFNGDDELDSFVVKVSQMCGKQISVYEPVVDGRLSDGSRLQTTLAKTITQHSTFTIRKFREDPLTPIDLIANNTMSVHMAAYFWMAIEKNASILFCGGTATGKTTMLNALSLFLPASYKIVSIEDTREINLPHKNWIAGTTRTGFSTSDKAKTSKDIDMFDLVRIALRQRPRVIIVGEVRGREAYTLFQAMTTGHLSYSTIHAGDLHSLIQRLESPPISLPRALLTSLDLVVFLNSVTVKGKPVRRVTNVTEMIKLDPETNRLVIMTPFHWVSEIDDRFEANSKSNILNEIKLQNGWSDDRLHQELNNRMVILEWMKRKNLRSYEEVGKIMSEYHKDPESVLRKVKEGTL